MAMVTPTFGGLVRLSTHNKDQDIDGWDNWMLAPMAVFLSIVGLILVAAYLSRCFGRYADGTDEVPRVREEEAKETYRNTLLTDGRSLELSLFECFAVQGMQSLQAATAALLASQRGPKAILETSLRLQSYVPQLFRLCGLRILFLFRGGRIILCLVKTISIRL
jgi:hypothetical protein